MKVLTWLFSFSDEYYKLAESYENSRYPFFRFLLFTITAAFPTLLYWGSSAIGFGEAWLGALLLLVLSILAWLKTPKELFLLSLVAFVHGFWILIERKKVKTPQNEENLEVDNKKKKRTVKWEKSNSNPAWDFILGVVGMILSVVSLISPFIFIASLN